MKARSMRVKLLIFILCLTASIAISLFSYPVNADWISTCDQNGNLKTSFYSNETVYVTSGNITSTGDQSVRVYIVENNNSWVEGKALVDATGTSYKLLTTNSSGHLAVASMWVTPKVGVYDIVADVNKDGVYNSSYDYINSSTTTGFTVLQAPIPTLHVAAGTKNPASHDWNLTNDTGHNPMLQLNFTATIEPVKINSIAITASGTGDDKKDIAVAYLILEADGDGQYDQGELLLSYSNYPFDDGVITFEIGGGQVVDITGSVTMLITYYMSSAGEVGSTYKFDVLLISAVGANTGETASVTGLPIGSAIKTISGSTAATTTTTTTTTIPTDECQADADCGGVTCKDKQKTTYKCEYNSNKGVNICASKILDVGCCGDADCVEDYYCLNYKCVEEGGLVSWLSGGLGERNYTWTIVSIIVVIGLALVAFYIIKNRQKKQWKSRKEYERDWEGLRGRWGEKK